MRCICNSVVQTETVDYPLDRVPGKEQVFYGTVSNIAKNESRYEKLSETYYSIIFCVTLFITWMPLNYG